MTEKPKGGGRDSRQDFRVDMAISLRYKVASKIGGGAYQLSPYMRGIGVNFSGGGGAFKIGKDIPAGSFIYLEMYFPFDRFPVSAVAEIIRTKPDTLRGKAVFLCITRYLLISPTIQDKMVAYFIGEGARRRKAEG